jgi:hypothetical protein
MTEIRLKPNPDWHEAAQRLVSGCLSLSTLDERVELMERFCISLGDALYPTFLQILCIIGQRGDHPAKFLITETLVHGLRTGRLPSGKLAAWGSTTFSADQLMGKMRSFGPIEYLLLWYAQPSGRSPLPITRFQSAAKDLLSLFAANPEAETLYCQKLLSAVEDPLDGAMSSRSRQAIQSFVIAWQNGDSNDRVIDRFLDNLQGDSISRLKELELFS